MQTALILRMARRFLLALVVLAACSTTTTEPRGSASSSSGGESSSSGSGGVGTEGGAPSTGGGGGLALTGGSVVDPAAKTVEARTLYICDGHVVDEAKGQSCATQTVDVSGKFLVPGFTDMHVHTRGTSKGDESFVDSSVEQEAPIFRTAGITAFLDAMSDETKIFPARDMQRTSADPGGADIFTAGAAFTPTGGHGTEYELPATSTRIVDSAADVATQMASLEPKKPDVVKIMYDHRGDDGGPDVKDGQQGALGVAMKKDVMIAIVAEANAKGLKTEVHIGTWSDARDAIAAGATCIAHLGEPAVPADVVSSAAAKGVYWIPTQQLYRGLNDLIANPALIDDPLLTKVATADVRDSYRDGHRNIDRYTTAWMARHTLDLANVKALRDGGVKLLAGTDVVEVGVFIGWSLHRELSAFVEAGLSPWEALAAATTTAGAFLGHDFGIAPGAEANVLVLEASPIDDIANTMKIAHVIHHGQLVP